uniref:Uncharacterized protein n=1 Tax=Candidatus Desulfatibia profunda TaxID=2841695 RepID=A0A8J6NRD3_9BACT|nr:hypothetical protein [Candidatus Desulfatibia profunda]
MADYGLKIFDASGNVTLDLTDTITRLRYSNEVAAGASDNTTLSDIDGLLTVELSIQLETGYTKLGHQILRSGTTITWTALSGTGYSSAKSHIFVFLYT